MKNFNTTICSSEPETISEKVPRMAPPEESSSISVSVGVLSPERPVRSRRRRTRMRKMISRAEEESTEKDELFEKKIVALKKIVPGGETLDVENLFEETADYILSLQYKVEALRFLVTIVESSENNKRKLGG